MPRTSIFKRGKAKDESEKRQDSLLRAKAHSATKQGNEKSACDFRPRTERNLASVMPFNDESSSMINGLRAQRNPGNAQDL